MKAANVDLLVLAVTAVVFAIYMAPTALRLFTPKPTITAPSASISTVVAPTPSSSASAAEELPVTKRAH